MPNGMPTDGRTIYVIVDGVNLGSPVYNVYREDIATLFPGYANTNGALAYFDFDTTGYSNGVHTIAWAATDEAGNADGIGSRYFTIQNTTQERGGTKDEGRGTRDEGGRKKRFSGLEMMSAAQESPGAVQTGSTHGVEVDYAGPVDFIKGYGRNVEPCEIYPDENGITFIGITELERVELHLTPNTPELTLQAGYQVVGDRFKPLPVGSTMDNERGIFYWQPGLGFVGDYLFTFIEKDTTGEMRRKNILIRIAPKSSMLP